MSRVYYIVNRRCVVDNGCRILLVIVFAIVPRALAFREASLPEFDEEEKKDVDIKALFG